MDVVFGGAATAEGRGNGGGDRGVHGVWRGRSVNGLRGRILGYLFQIPPFHCSLSVVMGVTSPLSSITTTIVLI